MLEITDMELVQMLRCCGKAEESADCGHCPAADYGCAGAFLRTAHWMPLPEPPGTEGVE